MILEDDAEWGEDVKCYMRGTCELSVALEDAEINHDDDTIA